jgi:hypothetical protein
LPKFGIFLEKNQLFFNCKSFAKLNKNIDETELTEKKMINNQIHTLNMELSIIIIIAGF